MEDNEDASLLFSLPWELLHDSHSFLFQGEKPAQHFYFGIQETYTGRIGKKGNPDYSI
jgi:hypothetical protein